MSDLDLIANALLDFIKDHEARFPAFYRLPAQRLYVVFINRSRIWLGRPHLGVMDRKAITKKALDLLRRHGKIICAPIYSTCRRYKNGKPYHPVRYYTYRSVDNVLDLLAVNIKSGESDAS